MKVIFGSFEPKPSVCYKDEVTTGYNIIAQCCDGYWHNLLEYKDEADLVLSCSPPMEHFPTQKPMNWKKLVLLQESGFGVINAWFFLNALIASPFDAFLLHNRDMLDFYRVLGKPVYHFNHPYQWSISATSKSYKVPNRVMVNLSRIYSTEGNVTGTLAVIQRMPDLQFVCFCEQYELLRKWTKTLGINNLICSPPLHWPLYMREAAMCSAFFSMDNRMTIGRFAMDAAALSTPCVGVASEAQTNLFPEFLVEPTQIQEATRKLRTALSFADWNVPAERKAPYDIYRFRTEFPSLCERILSD